MKGKYWVFALLILCLSFVIVGCGGGDDDDNDETQGVALTISTYVSGGVSGFGLDPGSTVVINDFATGNEITRGTLNQAGESVLRVTPGRSIVIIATGTSC